MSNFVNKTLQGTTFLSNNNIAIDAEKSSETVVSRKNLTDDPPGQQVAVKHESVEGKYNHSSASGTKKFVKTDRLR